MVRWNDHHDAKLRRLVDRNEINPSEPLDPKKIWKLCRREEFRETITEGKHAKNTAIQRMRNKLLRLREEFALQGGRRQEQGARISCALSLFY